MRQLMSAKAKEKEQEEIVIVRDFPKVFLDDLSRLPPVREIEYRIKLIPEATPVAKSLYRLTPSELEELSDEELREFTSEYYIPFALHPVVPAANASIADFPEGKVGVYTRFFEFANQRVPLSLFMCNVLNYYRLHISQLHCIGAAKITNFEVNCRLLAINPTVHLFRAFYHTSWSNGWVSFSKRAGPLQCYTEKLDALRRWREMFFWVDDALVPWDFAFYTQGSLPRDEHEELREFTSEYYIPFALHPVVPAASASIADFPEGKVGKWICLACSFRVRPKLVTEGCLPLKMVEPLFGKYCRATVGTCAGASELKYLGIIPPHTTATVYQAGEVDTVVKRQEADQLMTAHVQRGCVMSSRCVEATSVSSAPVTHVVQSPPPTSPLTADDISKRDRETGPKAFEGMPVDQLMEEFDMVTAQQAALVAQLRARFSNERSQSIQKDEEILMLKAQLADAQAEAESSRLQGELSLGCEVLGGGKNNHFAGLEEFRKRVEELLEKQEEKLRKLSIEYDEELYPHMLSVIAERRWLISHGLRLAAMGALESQEVKQSFGDVVKCALARGKAEAVEELHEKKLLTVPAAQVPRYNDNAYEELVAAMETMKLLELPHIAQLKRDQDYPIGVIMAGLTLARHAAEGAEAFPLRAVPIFACLLEEGGEGQGNIMRCWCMHIPHSDGVPVSVATVSPKDSELLGKLEEARDAAY
ncbi:hypothetical protein Tco_0777840 [Tanacetum coccineum]